MVYKRFRFLVLTRVVLLFVALLTTAYLLQLERHTVTAIIMGAIILFQVAELIRYVERTNHKLTKFLESIRHSDFSTSFSDHGAGKSFKELSTAFNQVIDDFKKTRAEKQEHFNYLQTVVQHVSIGIIAFKRDGQVDMFNNAVKRMFRINNLRSIQDLGQIKAVLPDLLMQMRAGDRNLIKVVVDDELIQLSVYATEFRMREEEFVLVSLQNIHSELEEKEIESWQKLIRVLTHEIMNSITPISSLAGTVQDILIDPASEVPQLNTLDEEDVESITSALSTIENRSRGLLNFVEIYRNLTRIPKPNFRYFPVQDLFDRANHLLQPKFNELNIDANCRVLPENLMVTADPDLMDQVIINLLLNAIDAVRLMDQPLISVVAYSNQQGRVTIELKDNGYGIKPDILDKIFMPFFTSKKNGSGIGLSLSRQIMHLHKGSIAVKSKPGEGTVFSLVF